MFRKVSIIFAVVIAISVSILNVFTTATVHALDAEKNILFHDRDQISPNYKWEVRDIYQDLSAFYAECKFLEEKAENFEKYADKIGCLLKEDFKNLLDDYIDITRLSEKIYVYAKVNFDVNTSNTRNQILMDSALRLIGFVGSKTSFLIPEIISMQEDKLDDLRNWEGLKDYQRLIDGIISLKPFVLSNKEENLLAMVSFVSGMPDEVYMMLSKDIEFPSIIDENGNSIKLTNTNFTKFLQSPNRGIRKEVFETFYSTYEHYQDTYAKLMASNVRIDNFYAAVRGYESTLKSKLYGNEIPFEVFDELIDTVNDNLYLLQRYMDLKRKIIGVDTLHMYDVYASISEESQEDGRYIAFEEAKDKVLLGLEPMGKEYVSILEKAFEDGWIDVFTTPDKVSGAYQIGLYGVHPYVLLNYQGTNYDAFIIAHELGHAMQTYYSDKNQPFMYSNYPIFTAEVASTLNETILFKSMYKNAKTKKEKICLLESYLENFRATLFRQTMFSEFEKIIHDKDNAGEALTAGTLKEIYLELNKKYYGQGVVSDDEIGMEWARVPHFYNSYYVYQYATSFAASQALAKQIFNEGHTASERIIKNFLSSGDLYSPIETLRRVDVDMSTSKPIWDAMKLFEEALDELEELAKEN